MNSLTYTQLLRGNPAFRRVWLGQVVSEMGSWFDMIAALGLVRVVSGASPEAAAWILALRFVPFALLGPLAGTWVDRNSRRTVMLVADFARAFVVLGFLLVRGPEDLWLAYLCAGLNSALGAFFEAGKNGALPNLVGPEGLLAGNALMFSTRFLFMALGASLGGIVVTLTGYQTAFVVDAVSFLVSAWCIWRVPESKMRAAVTKSESDAPRSKFWEDWRDGWRYIFSRKDVMLLISLNVLWAFGGGAANLLYERLGGIVLGPKAGWSSDAAVAVLMTSLGISLFAGMLLARPVGTWVEANGFTVPFIGWMLILHGLLFMLAGVWANLWYVAVMIFLSRLVIGMEFGLQDTLLMRALPDNLRGRVISSDRAAETLVVGLSLFLTGRLLRWISPQTMMFISGFFSGLPGLVWLLANKNAEARTQ